MQIDFLGHRILVRCCAIEKKHKIMIKEPFTLLALLSAVPGAWLAFKKMFLRDIRDQMVDLRNPGGIGTNTVTFGYKMIAYLLIGPQKNWLDLFTPTSEVYERALTSDKTSGIRILMWFFSAFVFSFLAWYLD